jgi:Squalene-hopene cyclase C-terminal domain
MTSRRQFLARSAALLGLTGTALAVPGDGQDQLPDGSAARGMITPETERAIEGGLSFLKLQQHRDGAFGTGTYRGNVAISSLGGLAMMAGGHLPGRGPYGKVVADALQYVMNQESTPPGYLNNANATPHGPMYGHGFGTLFLAEVYGMVSDERMRRDLRDKLKRAVNLILDSQNVEGGWRYHPSSRDADISVTICQVMALRAARNAGFSVPKAKVDRCVEYVKRCQDRMGGWFRYQAQGGPQGGEHQAFARTAAGVCALYSAGIYKGEEVQLGLDFLMRWKPNGHFFNHTMHYFYGHYYAAQAMWTAGGKYWQEWFPAIRDELLGRQRNDGSWQDLICTHYGTAMACIILQIPNNYLPILQK